MTLAFVPSTGQSFKVVDLPLNLHYTEISRR